VFRLWKRGKFLGGTEQRIRVQTADGIVECPVKEILTITFSAPSFEMTPTPESKQKTLILIPGTRLSIRLLDMLDTIQSKKDDWFGVTLDAALVVEGIEIAPKGAMAHGQVVQAEQGKYGSALVITLREIILKQQIIPIVTTITRFTTNPRKLLTLIL